MLSLTYQLTHINLGTYIDINVEVNYDNVVGWNCTEYCGLRSTNTDHIFTLSFQFRGGGGVIFKTPIINVGEGTFVKWKPLNATFKGNFKIFDSPTLFLLTPFVNFPPWKRSTFLVLWALMKSIYCTISHWLCLITKWSVSSWRMLLETWQ